MKESHSLRGFARLVADLRSAQRDYFRTRTDEALVRAKDLERKVDAALREVLSPTLFGADDDT
jgi:hypothetical protein